MAAANTKHTSIQKNQKNTHTAMDVKKRKRRKNTTN